jgi:hypothetical protein
MRRFSIRALMASVVASAIGLAALRDANAMWAVIMLLVALSAIDAAILAAVLMPGRPRAWWAGFAAFSGGYLVAGLSPAGLELSTTRALGYVHSQVLKPPEAWSVPQVADSASPSLAAPSVPPVNPWRAALPGAADLAAFERVGHSLFALLAGLVGGTVAVFVHARRERVVGPVGRARDDGGTWNGWSSDET